MSNIARHQRPLGTSIMEAVIATGLMTVAMLTLGMFRGRVSESSQSLRQASVARAEVINARERIGTWVSSNVTEASIREIAMSDSAKRLLPDARWISTVTEISQPIRGKRIFVDLQWPHRGQMLSTAGLAFWLAEDQPKSESEQPPSDSEQVTEQSMSPERETDDE